MCFNSEPRPQTVCQLGPLTVELGEKQRTCRGCRVKINKGTYHISIAKGMGGSDYRFCQECTENAAGWCELSNRRNL